MSERKQAGRLAMRVEGDWWTAYYALPDTMEGAIDLGRIRMGLIVGDDAARDAFMDVMRRAVGKIIGKGLPPGSVTWPDPPGPAPEHERAGRG